MSEGVLNILELKYKNEFVRYKLLDVIGDIIFLGKVIKGKIIVIKFGYFVNVVFILLLKKKY